MRDTDPIHARIPTCISDSPSPPRTNAGDADGWAAAYSAVNLPPPGSLGLRFVGREGGCMKRNGRWRGGRGLWEYDMVAVWWFEEGGDG